MLNTTPAIEQTLPSAWVIPRDTQGRHTDETVDCRVSRRWDHWRARGSAVAHGDVGAATAEWGNDRQR